MNLRQLQKDLDELKKIVEDIKILLYQQVLKQDDQIKNDEPVLIDEPIPEIPEISSKRIRVRKPLTRVRTYSNIQQLEKQ